MSYTILDRFFARERKKYGEANYFFKAKCLSSKIISFYTRFFNPRYRQMTTMRYPHTYFGGDGKRSHLSCVRTEFHENVHKFDAWKTGSLWFTLKFAYPQILALPFLIAAITMAGWWGLAGFGAFALLFHLGLIPLAVSAAKAKDKMTTSKTSQALFWIYMITGVAVLLGGVIYGGRWWALLLLGMPVFISPWPFKAVFRRDYELRGYTMTLFRIFFLEGELNEFTIRGYAQLFGESGYFFMEPNVDYVEKEFMFQVGRFQTDLEGFLENWEWSRKPGVLDPIEAVPFRMAYGFMKNEGLLHE